MSSINLLSLQIGEISVTELESINIEFLLYGGRSLWILNASPGWRTVITLLS